MTSHLTVSSTTTSGIGASRAFNAQVSLDDAVDPSGLAGFAAMLGLVDQPTLAPAIPAVSTPTLELLAGTAIEPDTETDGESDPQSPEAIAVALNAVMPIVPAPTSPEDIKPLLTDMLGNLNKLKTDLETKQAVDPDLLAKLDTQLDKLGEALGIDFDKMPATPEELAIIIAKPVAPDATVSAKLEAGMAPLAASLLEGQTLSQVAPEAIALSKSVGEKLGALVSAIDGSADLQQVLAQQVEGPTTETSAQPNDTLAADINKLLAPAASLDPVDVAPVLAKPALKLTEPVIAGDAAAEVVVPSGTKTDVEPTLPVAAKAVEVAATSSENKSDTDQSPERKHRDNNTLDAKSAPVAVAGSVDSKTDVQPQVQPQQHTARAEVVPAARIVQTGYQTSQQQLNLPQIAFELARQAGDGNTRFQMRLDPAELGRIDVRLDIDSTGQVNARLTVEKAETLDLMQRDQRGLEKALAQAGLDSSKTTLEFSLRQNSSGESQQQWREQAGRGLASPSLPGDPVIEAPPTINLYRASLSASGVNILA